MENVKNVQDVVGMPPTEAGYRILNGLLKSKAIETQMLPQWPLSKEYVVAHLMKDLIGNRLVTSDGTLVGTVDDFSFSLENEELIYLYLILQNTREYLELPVTLIENFGDDTIFVPDNYMEHSIKIYFMKKDQPAYANGKRAL